MVKVKTLWTEQKGKCHFCGCDTQLKPTTRKRMKKDDATVEHMIPRIKGGSSRRANLKMACFSCNNDRSDMDADQWMLIVNNPIKISAFHTIRELKRKLRGIRKRRKRKAKILEEYGMYYIFHTIPIQQFNHWFGEQTQ